jgi:large subunit ribosomal protein L11
MAKQTVDALVEGGKASAAPPLGPALGPLGVNIGQVVQEINKKTDGFKGMQVPVKVIVDDSTKEFTITVGTPPASALIKKEAGLQKGSGNPLADKVADLKIEQVIKISKMKEDAMMGKDNFSRVKEVIGTCDSMGVMVEGKQAREVIKDINQGSFKDKIEQGKTELSAEELKALEEERKRLEQEMKARREEFLTKANAILKELEGKGKGEIKAKMHEAKIPEAIIKEVMPDEGAAGAGAAKPGEEKKEEPKKEEKK